MGFKSWAMSVGERWRACRSAEEFRMPGGSGEHPAYRKGRHAEFFRILAIPDNRLLSRCPDPPSHPHGGKGKEKQNVPPDSTHTIPTMKRFASFGTGLLLLTLIAVITGIVLLPFYRATAAEAHQSVAAIQA